MTMKNFKKGAADSTGVARIILALGAVLIVAFLAFAMVNVKDNRSTGERIGDAVDALPHGVGEASQRLGDETPGEKLGDALQDARENVK